MRVNREKYGINNHTIYLGDMPQGFFFLLFAFMKSYGFYKNCDSTEKSDFHRELIPFLKTLFIYLFSAVLGLCCCMDFSQIAASGASPLVALHGLLTAVASLVWSTGSRASRLQWLWHVGSVLATPRL